MPPGERADTSIRLLPPQGKYAKDFPTPRYFLSAQRTKWRQSLFPPQASNLKRLKFPAFTVSFRLKISSAILLRFRIFSALQKRRKKSYSTLSRTLLSASAAMSAARLSEWRQSSAYIPQFTSRTPIRELRTRRLPRKLTRLCSRLKRQRNILKQKILPLLRGFPSAAKFSEPTAVSAAPSLESVIIRS